MPYIKLDIAEELRKYLNNEPMNTPPEVIFRIIDNLNAAQRRKVARVRDR